MADLEARVEKLEDENKQLKAQVEELEQAVRQLGGSVGGGGGGAAAAPKPRAATAKKPAAKRPSTSGPSGPRPATAKAPKSGGAKDGKELPKFTKLDGKLYKSSSVDDVPEERRTSYNIGKTKITVSLPEGVSPEAKGEEPAGELTLAVARGFNGGSNNNLYTIGDNVVYNLAGMGIVWNRSTNEQAFFTEHSEDVLSIAAHAEKGLVATGQADPKGKGTPFICIWNAADRSLVRKITYHDRGVIALAFSNDGKYLFSVGGDDNQTLAVWEVDGKGKKPNANLSAGKISGSGTGPDIFGIWNVPSGGEEKDGVATFATLGRKHSKLWSFDGEKLSNRNISTYEKTKVIAKYFNGAASLGNDYYLHCETGEVFKMRGANVVAYKRVTDNGRGVVVNADGHIVVIGAGGKHGKIAVWTHAELEGDALPKPKIVDLKAEVNDIEASAVAVHNGKVLVGLKSNQVLEVDFNTGESTLIIDGHKEETWGLAASPDGSLLASSALDKRVKLWSAGALVPDCTIKVKEKARSLAWSPDGKHVAVGLWDGTVSLIDVASRSVVTSKKIAGETVDGMAFSPDGSQLALASWDQCLYTLSVPDLEKKHKFKGHTSSVMHLQWSEDGKYIMTDSRDYEILFWNTETGKRVERQSEIMDVKYPKWNCFLGWAVQGIWAGAGDGTDINAVDSFGNLLVAGDDFGEVRLYAFPSLAKDAPRKGYKGHSSHVANVRFSHDGKSLYSAGGNDTAVVEWRVA